jgi:hypothetical protein
MKVLVDSSVLLDVFTQDPHWARWSEEKLSWHAERDLLAVNPIIYAEVPRTSARWKNLMKCYLPLIFNVCRCDMRRDFWRPSVFLPSVADADKCEKYTVIVSQITNAAGSREVGQSLIGGSAVDL